MAVDTHVRRSRRAVLLSAGAATGAAAAAVLGRPLATRADNGDPVLLGVVGQTATTTTEVTTSGGDGLAGTTSSSTGIGVVGYNSATSGAGIGVMGRQTSDGDGSGVYGQADDGGTGVFGMSGSTFVPSVAKTGVYGRTTHADANARGVWGESDAGSGLYGKTTTGFALQTVGRLKFDMSGVATIPTGSKGVTVIPGVDVSAGSFVLLTPRIKLGGRDLWFTTDPAGNTFRIRMSSARPNPTPVSWLLLG